uniref:Uncharacterized protein n=1 Tax=Trieres chinensis TaxID=1514140 RepID=A0A7S1Z1N8_TRICV
MMPNAAALTQPKFAVAGVVAGWLALLVLWLPFKLLSMVVTEIGVYALVVGGGYKLGRSLVRLIAFPGSTHRVYGEIEAEFARYSVRMLDASCSNVIEAAEAAIYLGDEDTGDESSQRPVRNAGMFRMGMGDLGPLWRRAGSYRDRVLGMYSDVMSNLVEASEGRPPADDLGAGSGGLNKYGNNPLKGDVGDLSTVTPQSREDAKALSELLHRALVNMDQAERAMGPVLNDKSGGTSRSSTPPEAVAKCRALLRTAMELKEFLPSLRPPSQNDTSNGGGGNSSGGNGDEGNERNGLQSPNQSADDAMANTAGDPSGPSGAVDAVRSGAASVLTVVDPPPHPSPFGLDVLRGCMLSRYKGARQLWVRRPGTKFSGGGGGRVDVIHIPAEGGAATASRGSIPRAVLYCNPNAGLSEVATGMSLIGGNVTPESAQPKGSSGSASFADENCWTDFYLRTGYDVFLFNYAGFGRSHGGRARTKSYKSGCVPRVGRMAKGALWDFAPSAQTLKTDAHAVARHLVTELGVERLVVHGESIGGMAAAGAARRLGEKGAVDMSLNRRASHPALLLCDRSFSNLEGVAQRLVGSWTGDAIRALTPLWNTDVASDFLSASCPKAVASDASDAIIADASSLKSGLALSLELRGGKTKGAGRMVSPPLEYRMSDWEGTGAGRSKFAPGKVVQVPTWPNDRRITENEAFHFAACARRIGKAASSARRRTGYNAYTPATGPSEEEDEGIEITELELTEEDGNINDTGVGGKGGNGGSLPPNPEALLVDAWRSLACTDGLCGLPLGAAIKDGHDAVVSWLCCAVIFGGQVVVSAAQKRALGPGGGGARGTEQTTILPEDFDFRPGGYELTEEDGTGVHPVPLPEVVALLRRALDAASGGGVLSDLAPELRYCAGMLDYVVTRISSAGVVRDSTRALRLKPPLSDGGGGRLGCGSSGSPGRFMDLRCGHNNQYSGEEKEMLRGVLRLVDDDGGNNVV